MTGWLTLRSGAELYERFEIPQHIETNLLPRDDIAPPQQLLIVVEESMGRCLRWVRWSFRPPWFALRPSEPSLTTLAAEAVARNPGLQQIAWHSRCIIPADGIGAWRRLMGARRRQPVHVQLRSVGLFGIAGLYTEYLDASSGRRRASCVLLTIRADEPFSALDGRMPAILRREDERVWLRCSQFTPASALACLQPYAAAELEIVPAETPERTAAPSLPAAPAGRGSRDSDAA